MKLLQALIYEDQRKAVVEERAEKRRQQIGSGERSERIRTYNFPQVCVVHTVCLSSGLDRFIFVFFPLC